MTERGGLGGGGGLAMKVMTAGHVVKAQHEGDLEAESAGMRSGRLAVSDGENSGRMQ